MYLIVCCTVSILHFSSVVVSLCPLLISEDFSLFRIRNLFWEEVLAYLVLLVFILVSGAVDFADVDLPQNKEYACFILAFVLMF